MKDLTITDNLRNLCIYCKGQISHKDGETNQFHQYCFDLIEEYNIEISDISDLFIEYVSSLVHKVDWESILKACPKIE